LPVREYPVDFGVQSTESYNCQLTVPEGYKVEELPKSMSLLLENKGGQFQYQVTQVDNKVLLSLRILINKAFFLPSEYQSLKSFYNSIINKESEQIILKKI